MDWILYMTLTIVFIIIVISVNVAEIIILARKKDKRKTYECFLLSLSVSDFVLGLTKIIFVFTVWNFNQYDLKDLTYVASYSHVYYFFIPSILNLTWISFNRLWAIAKPISYKFTWTRKRVNRSIVFIWLVAIVTSISVMGIDYKTQESYPTSLCPIFEDGFFNRTIPSNLGEILDECLRANRAISVNFALAIAIVIFNSMFIITNTAVVFISQAKKRQSNTLNKSAPSKGEDKATFVCILTTLVFIVFTLPYVVDLFRGKFTEIFDLLLLVNSAVNSFIYFFRNKLKCCCMRNQQKKNNQHQLRNVNGNIKSKQAKITQEIHQVQSV